MFTIHSKLLKLDEASGDFKYNGYFVISNVDPVKSLSVTTDCLEFNTMTAKDLKVGCKLVRSQGFVGGVHRPTLVAEITEIVDNDDEPLTSADYLCE